ncbi:peptide MFS transporter [Legionella sp.]|uniref:peptide MFS transporter n=1 Tax=Legionella sp. TaxID=459 RepID=UPI003C9E9A1B
MPSLSEKHPKSLSIFFATEMWERYGFYVVQSLLALYLALCFKWPDKQTYALVGCFTALTYLSPVAGGWIADKLIGQKRSVLLGAVVLFISYCFLATVNNPTVLTAALAGIAVGTGLLKPNISSLLGNEYLLSSVRRESGFTIFYMGITSGIILGTTIPSLLYEYFGWPASFASAAIGMIIAFTVFFVGIKIYQIKDYNPFVFEYKKTVAALSLMVFLWSLFFYILNSPHLSNLFFSFIVLLSAGYIVYAIYGENANQSRQTLVIGLLCIISVVFWTFYFQMFMSLTLFISRVVEPTLIGIQFPPPYYVTIQSIGMLIIGYFLAKKNTKLNLMEQRLNIGKKFLYAIFIITAAYAIIVLVSNFTDRTSLLSPLLIIPAYLMFSLAELLLSPVGLAAITLLADKNKVSTMMGIFFVSLGIGGFLSGKLASLTAIPEGETNIAVLKTLYAAAFTQQLEILFIASLGCLILFGLIKFLLTPVH